MFREELAYSFDFFILTNDYFVVDCPPCLAMSFPLLIFIPDSFPLLAASASPLIRDCFVSFWLDLSPGKSFLLPERMEFLRTFDKLGVICLTKRGAMIVRTARPSHWGRKYAEATRVSRLWYPRPKLRENTSGNPVIAERIYRLLEYGYTVRELVNWFRLNHKNIRASTNTAEANAIWADIKACYNFRCAYCGKRTHLARDHIIPISRSGSDSMDNIVPACKTCNSSKHAKALLDWNKFRHLQLHLLGF